MPCELCIMMADGQKMGIRHSSSFGVCKLYGLFLIVLIFGFLPQLIQGQNGNGNSISQDCYVNGVARKCMPEFVNAVFNLTVEATNTCGESRAIDYCLQTGVTGARKQCHICDAFTPGLAHPPEFMTDFNNQKNWTWWQSETMLQGIQYPTVVNLTLNLKKAYEVTYVRLRFHSPRPESFAIYKKTTDDGPWIPYQFYSGSCQRTYNLSRRGIITLETEGQAICTDEYSDISPLTGGSVPFSTLEGRPSAFNFENSPLLQEWVTATAIRIVLTRMNTFGDEVFGDEQVLRSYFYAISDLAVGAKCKCNGHARDCVKERNSDQSIQLVCRCQHNTAGPNCEKCRPEYNDRPWARATDDNAHECQACNCNGKADRCYFDADLFSRTGHGGHCIDCRENTDGPNCERCKDNHFVENSRCTPCNCNPTGSESLQCDNFGTCQCKPGVTGPKCDRCENNHYDFGPIGCRPCGCSVAGSVDNYARCDPQDGTCTCKANVEGRTCDRCKLGFFALREDDPQGCIPCFCYGHSSDCVSSTGFYSSSIVTDFGTGKQRWTAVDRANNMVATQYNAIVENLGVKAPGSEPVHFVAPSRYLGDQRFSYNQYLTFDLRVGEESSSPSVVDIVFEGSGQRFSSAIFVQGNKMPEITSHTYKFRLNERPNSQWTPRLKAQDFISILSNLTAIKIRATYVNEGTGFIDNISLDTARLGSNGGAPATWVEQCTCPEGYVGQFCESCSAGYKRDPPNGGPFSRCVPCQCFGHSDSCEPNTGRCICQHNTEGDFCEKCASGYYGNAREGTPDDCQPCPCPDGGPCVELPQDVVCTSCKEGHGGNRCDVCLDGYHGDPSGKNGAAKPCQPCSCNENVDPNAVRNCDRLSGECLKCIFSTDGFNCERCLPNYYGDALLLPKGNCTDCKCYQPGTQNAGDIQCDSKTGQCYCLTHVTGQQCDQCEAGYWNIDSGSGCENCDCDFIGSLDNTCDIQTGQCKCRPGVTGLKCDVCQTNHFGFSVRGCEPCNCDPEGSQSLQCDEYGNCPCNENIEGKRCDMCMENKYNLTAGCIDCPPCYTLVQEKVNAHRFKLRELQNLIVNIGDNPSAFNDTQFLKHMNQVNDSVNMLLDEARGAVSDDGSLNKQLSDLRAAVNNVMAESVTISNNIRAADNLANSSLGDIQVAQEAIGRAEKALESAKDYIETQGASAMLRAREALKQYGQKNQQMTDIAMKTKMESERQMEEAKEIERLAQHALNTSMEAKRLAEAIMMMPNATSRDLQRLKAQYGDADNLYNQTKFFAEQAHQRAKEAYEEALGLYRDATSMMLPKYDIKALLDTIEKVKQSAAGVKTDALRLMEDNSNLLKDVSSKKSEAERLLEEGDKHQQSVDKLLAEVHEARSKARDAVERAEKTLQEANQTLEELLRFDMQVKESKDKAEEALAKIPAIENLIEQAENKTREARDALSGAENDADRALALAQLAQDTATNASTEASNIRLEAEQTKNRAKDLKDTADDLKLQVDDVALEMDNYEAQAKTDSQLTETASDKADQAKKTAEQVSQEINNALETVKNISALLGQLVKVDVDKLDELERDLNAAEQQLLDADLENQYNKLNQANTDMKQLVSMYEREYSSLREEVDNIQEIRESLPDGCFKNIVIENPGSQ